MRGSPDRNPGRWEKTRGPTAGGRTGRRYRTRFHGATAFVFGSLGSRILQVPLDDRPREFGVAKGARLANLVASFSDLVALRVRSMLPRRAA